VLTSCRFLAASWLVRQVCNRAKHSVKAMHDAARTRVNNPEEIHSKSWKQIENSGGEYTDLARKTISWLIFAKRSLSPEEVTAALSIEPGVYSFDRQRSIFAENIQKACRGLVVLKAKGRRIKVAHASVKEYFLSREDFRVMRFELTRVCFTYIACSLNGVDECDEIFSPSIEIDEDDERGRLYSFEMPLDDSSTFDNSQAIARGGQLASGSSIRGALSSSSSSSLSSLSSYASTGFNEAVFSGSSDVGTDFTDEDSDDGQDRIARLTPPKMLAAWLPNELLRGMETRAFFKYSLSSCQWHLEECVRAEREQHLQAKRRECIQAKHEACIRAKRELCIEHDSEGWIDANSLPDDVITDVAGFLAAVVDCSEIHAIDSTPHKASRLHLAVLLGITTIVQQALDDPMQDLEARDSFQRTPSMWAALLNNDRLFNQLVEAGADINATDELGDGVLRYACFLTRDAILLKSILRMADAKFKDTTMLSSAIDAGNTKLSELLLDEPGVAPIQSEKHRLTPLHLALRRKDSALSMLLLERGASAAGYDNMGRTALLAAIFHHLDTNVIETLIKKDGQDILATDNKGLSALHLAVQHKYRKEAVIQLLLKAKCDPSLVSALGQTPLHVFLQEMDYTTGGYETLTAGEKLRIAKALTCSSEAMLQIGKKTRRNVFHLACASGSLLIVKHLLLAVHREQGEEGLRSALNALDSGGNPPLLVNASQRPPTILEHVLGHYKNCLDVKLQHHPYKNSYLHSAIELKLDKKWLQVLIKRCPELLQYECGRGWTPLFFAVERDHYVATQLLMSVELDLGRLCNDRHIFNQACQYCHSEDIPKLILGYTALDEWLLPKQKNPNWHLSEHRRNSIQILLREVNELDTSCLKIQEQVMASPNVAMSHTNDYGERAIHVATTRSSIRILRKVLARMSELDDDSLNQIASSGKSPLDFALERGNNEIIGELLSLKARPGLEWDENSSLITRWGQMTWYQDLQAALKDAITTPSSITACWRHDEKKRSDHVWFDEQKSGQVYIELEVPYGARSPVRRLQFVTTSHDQGQ
jgi:ankyrin repeat protein